MENYAVLSLETHLFFARIMKEHAFFLAAGFPCVKEEWIEKAHWYRQQFEDLLREVTELGDGKVNVPITKSGEMVTEHTIPAEKRTQQLAGIPIDSEISQKQLDLCAGSEEKDWREVTRAVHKINERAKELLNGFIDYKESILDEVAKGNLYNANYPLLIDHIQREAKLYRATLIELMSNRSLSYKNLRRTEEFWNRIMMEHALFIRGLLDPFEEKLIETADDFATEFKQLLLQARKQDCKAKGMTEKSLEEARKIRDFKNAGTEGILDCKITSIILPLLADHVLREANHYIRLLETEGAY